MSTFSKPISLCRNFILVSLTKAFTIYAIWGAHWASVMDEQPFLSGVIAVKTLVVIRRFLE
ncbi:hypothetical protein PHYBLDRAFT_139307 [Phycomyces blakesleeanus NRRL 1555(-)]|uniref:Uncharacterized protein n=1 Tax=Phycomyces blakesleeanus (strain ATCC 8743b / DSM 1359 / FGSC 10004 / NBRC 33097 / NRRL 1555) TaxID=763407 RepID=A0A162Y9Z6_PHYB8|nr:hypothetical protein PHYBLDRAFT_139307 [Phycomyces blakesleeanus NRRL 1555(-)]OAD79275.1 hypothetical protein PHYBLDRAFT_139307 [Phycomyces blakesleeanus NRRL 1555(-)]|eukprot:XP_018297315.1 hypothetical protein PHYBLDRAFT_139307 [Phycomyces blakesleeanus NRRL 1555(-)]